MKIIVIITTKNIILHILFSFRVVNAKPQSAVRVTCATVGRPPHQTLLETSYRSKLSRQSWQDAWHECRGSQQVRGQSDTLFRVKQFRCHVWIVSTIMKKIKRNKKKWLIAIAEGWGATRAVDSCPQCCVWLPNFEVWNIESKTLQVSSHFGTVSSKGCWMSSHKAQQDANRRAVWVRCWIKL